MSPRTTFLSKLIGLYCVLVSLAMLIHKQATLEMVASLHQNPALMFILGLFAMVAGLAMVLGHNIWSGGVLPVVVTVIGWASLMKGLLYLFLTPEGVDTYLAAIHFEQLFYVYAAITLIIGVCLSYAGFRSASH
ncbi:MAG: hypothetical protein ACRD50_12825 [Candidatus Acidiferrales bacterium]